MGGEIGSPEPEGLEITQELVGPERLSASVWSGAG